MLLHSSRILRHALSRQALAVAPRQPSCRGVTQQGRGLFAGRSGAPMTAGAGGSGGAGGRGGGRSVRVASGGASNNGSGGSGGLWGSYLNALETSPMLTRCVTCAVLNGVGDVFCQLFVEQHDFDANRFIKFSILGLVFVGPILTIWYGYLGSLVTAPGTQGAVISVLIDQFLFAPVFISAFMSVLTGLEGKPEKILPKLKQDLPDALKVNWALWIPAQYINFKFVPPNLRVLAVNIVALVWNTYISWQGHKAVAPAPVAATPSPKGSKK